MALVVKPAAVTDAAWIEVDPFDDVTISGTTFNAAWLSGLSDEEVAERGLVRAEVAGLAPVPGLGQPPELETVDGVPTWVWSEAGIESLRACRIGEVKAEAGRRILDRYPTWKQANMNMRATELVDIRLDRDLTTEETAEREAMLSAAAWIKEVRAASDVIEAALPDDAERLCAFIAATADGWPA